MRLLPVLALGAMVLPGCTYSIHNVHISDMSPAGLAAVSGEGRPVKAETKQFVIMSFVTQTDYVDEAYKKIQGACPNGEIRGLSTQHSTAHGFFSWTNKILIQGYCFDSTSARNGKSMPAVRGANDGSSKNGAKADEIQDISG